MPSFDAFALTQKIHPSRLEVMQRKIPESSLNLFEQVLFNSPVTSSLKEPLKEFIAHEWISIVFNSLERPILPLDASIPSAYRTIASYSSEEFYLFASFLGLYDLAIELKKNLDASLLEDLFKTLSPSMSYCLKQIMKEKMIVSFEKISLSQWDRKKESLEKMLSIRGMYRLSRAIYSLSEELSFQMALKTTTEEALFFTQKHPPFKDPKIQECLLKEIELMIEKRERL